MAVAANTLLDEAKCYACLGSFSMAQLLALAELRRWLISVVPTADTSAQALVEYSKCYACLGSLSMYELLSLAMIDQIAQA